MDHLAHSPHSLQVPWPTDPLAHTPHSPPSSLTHSLTSQVSQSTHKSTHIPTSHTTPLPTPVNLGLGLARPFDPFTKLNLNSSLDRANSKTYNPWEMISRLQTIAKTAPFDSRCYKQVPMIPKNHVYFLKSSLPPFCKGIIVWIQLGSRFRGFQPYAKAPPVRTTSYSTKSIHEGCN